MFYGVADISVRHRLPGIRLPFTTTLHRLHIASLTGQVGTVIAATIVISTGMRPGTTVDMIVGMIAGMTGNGATTEDCRPHSARACMSGRFTC